jgi:hypothetical protein
MTHSRRQRRSAVVAWGCLGLTGVTCNKLFIADRGRVVKADIPCSLGGGVPGGRRGFEKLVLKKQTFLSNQDEGNGEGKGASLMCYFWAPRPPSDTLVLNIDTLVLNIWNRNEA